MPGAGRARRAAAFGKIDVVASPALGGIVPGYETARWLGAKAIFVERENGVFKLAARLCDRAGRARADGRGHHHHRPVVARMPGGASPSIPARIVGAACLIDRSGGKAEIGVPRVALATLDIPAYPADALPPELAATAGDQAGQPRARGDHAPDRKGDRPWPRCASASTSITSRPCATRAAAPLPDPVRAALLAIEAGADGITAHLREDRRHIHDDDMARLKAAIAKPLNFEMAATEQMLDIALRIRPHACCLVPEKRTERTTEGGLDVVGGHDSLKPFVAELTRAGIRVSLFIEPSIGSAGSLRLAAARRWSNCTPAPGATRWSARERERADHEFARLARRRARPLALGPRMPRRPRPRLRHGAHDRRAAGDRRTQHRPFPDRRGDLRRPRRERAAMRAAMDEGRARGGSR